MKDDPLTKGSFRHLKRVLVCSRPGQTSHIPDTCKSVHLSGICEQAGAEGERPWVPPLRLATFPLEQRWGRGPRVSKQSLGSHRGGHSHLLPTPQTAPGWARAGSGRQHLLNQCGDAALCKGFPRPGAAHSQQPPSLTAANVCPGVEMGVCESVCACANVSVFVFMCIVCL